MSEALIEESPAPVIVSAIHEKFLPLLYTPHTYADIRGGRYGMKTECVHRIAVKRALEEPLRIVGARETLESTRDSSIKTISDIIYANKMATSQNGPFEVLTSEIRRRDGDRVVSQFTFIGVRENIRDKKSLAHVNLMLFDEAGKCSKDTLNVFLPTVIREAGCQAWFLWNPELRTDPIYQFFENPPPRTIRIETSYKDNPWLSEESRLLVEHTLRTDPDLYEHLYMGQPLDELKGGIFEAEMRAALAEGRIGSVPYDRTKPVHVVWDLGMDTTFIWFVQTAGEKLRFIDCYGNSDKDLTHYILEIQRRGYLIGINRLPHDGVSQVIHGRGLMGRNPDKSATIQSMLRDVGMRAEVGPTLLKADRIRFARSKFPLCYFDSEKCDADGLKGLRNYAWDREPDKNGVRKPLHNWASHPSDAFMEACVSVKEMVSRPVIVAHSGMAEADI